ncbi:MAG: hypothetical protein JZU67_07145 [Burkholderiaceae bacterium]|nr:hypothetical protein [Burkholderiaceae bacterium]
MASTASPYGLKAVNELGGLPYAGSTRSFAFDPAGYGANVYNGSLVYVKTTGYIEIVTATGADATTNGFPVGTANTGAVGVFVGCSYVNAQGQTVYSQYYPSGSLNAVAFVIDDDRTVFQVQSAGSVTQAALGSNVFFSTSAVAAFRVVGFVNMVGFSTVGDAYTDILVKFNPGYHSYSNAVGL